MPPKPLQAKPTAVAALDEAEKQAAEAKASIRSAVQWRLANASASSRRSLSADHGARSAVGPGRGGGSDSARLTSSHHVDANGARWELGDGSTNLPQYRLKSVRPDEVVYKKVHSRVFSTPTSHDTSRASASHIQPPSTVNTSEFDDGRAAVHRVTTLVPRRRGNGTVSGYVDMLPQTVASKLRALHQRRNREPLQPCRTGRPTTPAPLTIAAPPVTMLDPTQLELEYRPTVESERRDRARHTHDQRWATLSKRLQQLATPRGGRPPGSPGRARSVSPTAAGSASRRRPQTASVPRGRSTSGHRGDEASPKAVAAAVIREHAMYSAARQRSTGEIAAQLARRPMSADARVTRSTAYAPVLPATSKAPAGTIGIPPSAALGGARRVAPVRGAAVAGGAILRPHAQGNEPLPHNGMIAHRYDPMQHHVAAVRTSSVDSSTVHRPPLVPPAHFAGLEEPTAASNRSPLRTNWSSPPRLNNVQNGTHSLFTRHGVSPLHTSAELSPMSDRSPVGEKSYSASAFEIHVVNHALHQDMLASVEAPPEVARTQRYPQMRGGGLMDPDASPNRADEPDGEPHVTIVPLGAMTRVAPARRPAGFDRPPMPGHASSPHRSVQLSGAAGASPRDGSSRPMLGVVPLKLPTNIGEVSITRADLFQGHSAGAAPVSATRGYRPQPTMESDSDDDNDMSGSAPHITTSTWSRPRPPAATSGNAGRGGASPPNGRYGPTSANDAALQLLLSMAASSPI
jgi:hypothetical protein